MTEGTYINLMYLFYDGGNLTWHQAMTKCQKEGVNGLLAVIPDERTNHFIWSLMRMRSYIGAFYMLGSEQWSWVDDSVPFTYTNWARGEPTIPEKERYAEIYALEGTWNSINNEGSFGYVCQVDPIHAMKTTTPMIKEREMRAPPFFPPVTKSTEEWEYREFSLNPRTARSDSEICQEKENKSNVNGLIVGMSISLILLFASVALNIYQFRKMKSENAKTENSEI